MDDDFSREHSHRRPHRGEREAASKAAAGASSMRGAILEAVEAAGPDGLTPDEFCTGAMLINTVRRRFTDLWKDGLIRHHPGDLHRPNAAGNLCVAWVVGADPQRGAGRTNGRTPLPELEILDLAPAHMPPMEAVEFARAVERKHGISE